MADRNQVIESLNVRKEYVCDHPGCSKSFLHYSGLWRHKKSHNVDVADDDSTTVDLVGDDECEPIDAVVIEEQDNTQTPQTKEGWMYVITSPLVSSIKIGFWRASTQTLYDRYKTYYGDEVELYARKACDCVVVEYIFKKMFASCKLFNSKRELYNKNHHEYYKLIVKNLCLLSLNDLQHLASCCAEKESIDTISILKQLQYLSSAKLTNNTM